MQRKIDRTRRLLQYVQDQENRSRTAPLLMQPSLFQDADEARLEQDKDDIAKSMRMLFDAVDQMGECSEEYVELCTSVQHFPDQRKSELEEKYGKEIAEIFDGYRVGNPFETCFAYFYLLDSGDAFAWLYTMCISVTLAACRLLPWATMIEFHPRDCGGDWDDEEEEEPEEPEEETPDEEENAPIDWIGEESDLYAQKYTDACFWLYQENVKPEELIPMSLPQIVAEMTGTLMPRKMFWYTGTDFTCSGMDESTAKMLEQYCVLALYTDKTEYAPVVQTVETPENNDAGADMEEQNRRLKREIERLKELLNRSHQETAAEKSRAEQILKDSRRAQEELAELRSMFVVPAGSDKPELHAAVTFPYTAKHRIVLFGGHASWLRAIRPLLRNVRIVEPQTRPDTGLFVNADCI